MEIFTSYKIAKKKQMEKNYSGYTGPYYFVHCLTVLLVAACSGAVLSQVYQLDEDLLLEMGILQRISLGVILITL